MTAQTQTVSASTPATLSLSAIKADYRRFLYYEEIDGVHVPCWTWNEANFYTRPDGCVVYLA